MSADKITRQIFEAEQKAGLSAAGPILGGITIHEITPGPKTSVEHPCFAGKHRWAYLTNGRVACGYCGTPR